MKSYTEQAKQILKSNFGYDEFRPLQNEIIQNVLNGHDTLAVMPTGGGKSICYQIPALIMEGVCIVVSPLISLMQDQVSSLVENGIEAAFLNSSLDKEQYVNTIRKLKSQKIKILYASPEGLATGKIQSILKEAEIPVNLITIDEAHCISEWGHDFRPDYLEISCIREQFPSAVLLALTATATSSVRQDIVTQLKMKNPDILVASFNRKNIFLEVRPKKNAKNQVVEYILSHKDESGIIYCLSRKQVDELYDFLSQQGFSVLPYHAGLSDKVRAKNQDDFIKDKVRLMIATVALVVVLIYIMRFYCKKDVL